MAEYFPDIMVDIETTGLGSDNNAMIQLSAVKFDLVRQDVSTEFFNRSLMIPAWRYWDDSTWEWWRNDSNKREVLTQIFNKMEDPKLVMTAFVEWVGFGPVTWWSKPSHFDFPFVSSYCRDYGLAMPFDFRRANDMRSFMRGVTWPAAANEPKLDFQGQEHNAIHDTLHQIRVLFEFMNQNKKVIVDA